jgi:hypothetical protein
MRYHEHRITLDDRERLALDVLLESRKDDSMTPQAARVLLGIRFGEFMDCLDAARRRTDTRSIKGLPPKALERLNEAMDRADEYDDAGRHVGSPAIRNRFEYDEERGMSAILPLK